MNGLSHDSTGDKHASRQAALHNQLWSAIGRLGRLGDKVKPINEMADWHIACAIVELGKANDELVKATRVSTPTTEPVDS